MIKLKSEMLEKIRDIHELEVDLDNIEENSNIIQYKQAEGLEVEKSKKTINRNDEVMNEIKLILKDLVNIDESTIETSHHDLVQTISHVTQIYEEYENRPTDVDNKK